jgi:deoxyribodipyrimidine photo-lyase
VAAWARRAGVPWHEPRQFGVIRRLKSRNGWARAWDQDMAQPLTPPPTALTRLEGLRRAGPGARPLPASADRRPGGRPDDTGQFPQRPRPRLPLPDVQPGDGLRRQFPTVAAPDLGNDLYA